jgi:hypothetical protein
MAEATPEAPKISPSNSPEYIDMLQKDIEKVETSVLPNIGRKLQLLGTMDPTKTGELERGEMKKAHQEYGKLVSLRMELFLRSPEVQDRVKVLESEFGKLSFSQSSAQMINRVFRLFLPQKPNKQGQVTTPLLMTYQGITRVRVGTDLIDRIRDIDQLIPVSDPAQQAFLQKLRGLLVNPTKTVDDPTWSATGDGVMDIDPISKAEMAHRQLGALKTTGKGKDLQLNAVTFNADLAGAKKGWTKLGLATRFLGTVAASGMAVTAFIANRRQLDWPVAAYAGLAYLGAYGMPKGTFDNVMEQVKPLLSDDFRRLAQTYKFHEAPKDWSRIAMGINGMRQKNAAQFNKLLKPVREGATEEERVKGVQEFAKLVTSGIPDDSPAKLAFANMLPADLSTFATIVTTQRHRDAQVTMQQYFEKNMGPHMLAELGEPPAKP